MTAAKAIGGVSYNRLGEIERGASYRTDATTRPTRELLARIAVAYDLPVALLLAQAGYAEVGEATNLTPEQREVLMLFDGLSPDRRRLAIAMLETLRANDQHKADGTFEPSL